MKRNILVEIISSLLIVLFTYASLSKILDYNTFRFQLGRSPYLTRFPGFVAWFIPATELVTVMLLVLKKTKLIGLYASFFLMTIFTGYIYAMLHYSPFLPCSCGGILSAMSWDQHFYFNICFTLLSLAGIALFSKSKQLIILKS